MLSGVGDKSELEQHNIKMIHNNLHVGKNLQDHLFNFLSWETTDP